MIVAAKAGKGIFMKKQISKVKPDRALEVARKLVDQHVTIQELWQHISEAVDFGSEIGEAIDPEYKRLEDGNAWIAAQHALEAKLDPEGKKLFLQYDHDWCNRDYYRRLENFALGFAAASMFCGKEARRGK
jgi:hypothetical protein